MKNFLYIIPGILFGIVLTKSEVISWFRIRNMFLFREAHMYLIICSAIIVGIISVFLLKRSKIKSIQGEKLNFTGKQFHRGYILGGGIFGVGWSITGACPGPIYAQLGAGDFPAFFTLIGAILGAMFYSLVKNKLPH